MRGFLEKNRKLLSAGLSVICSVFLVALVVSAATTIGANISTGGTLSVTGASTLTGAVTVGGAIASDTNNTDDLGTSAIAWKDVYVTGTLYSGPIIAARDYVSVGKGSSSSTIRDGASATSTFNTGVEFDEGSSATTTLSLGHETDGTTKGEGGCLSIGATSSTTSGVQFLNVYVGITTAGELYLATSTSETACY